jgi:superfamily I DNA/RNA helicase
MYRYIRELEQPKFRTPKFWSKTADYEELSFVDLVEYCGLDLGEEHRSLPWFEVLKRNFTPNQVVYFVKLLERYGQKTIDGEPDIIIDTIHSVKGGEANNVLLYSKANWPSAFINKTSAEQSDEKRVIYTGVTRAKDTLHILSTDHKFNYPIGEDYLIFLQESKNV